jgi:hypothetical protein
MCVASFGGAGFVRIFVRVIAVAMAVAVVVEEEQSNDVGCKAERANNEDDLGVGDFLGLDKALNGFKEDGKAEGDEEDAIDECTQGFGSLPLRMVSMAC